MGGLGYRRGYDAIYVEYRAKDKIAYFAEALGGGSRADRYDLILLGNGKSLSSRS